jgi:hypothetical protein
MQRLPLLVSAILIAASLSGRAACDAEELDGLQKLFASTLPPRERLWRESKQVVDRCDWGITRTLMQCAEKWQGEEALAFVPLFAILPVEPLRTLLQQYDDQQKHAGWARKVLIALDSPDTKEMMRWLARHEHHGDARHLRRR